MFKDLHLTSDWLAEPLEYYSQKDLLEALDEGIIKEANRILKTIHSIKNKETKTRKAKDYKNDKLLQAIE